MRPTLRKISYAVAFVRSSSARIASNAKLESNENIAIIVMYVAEGCWLLKKRGKEVLLYKHTSSHAACVWHVFCRAREECTSCMLSVVAGSEENV